MVLFLATTTPIPIILQITNKTLSYINKKYILIKPNKIQMHHSPLYTNFNSRLLIPPSGATKNRLLVYNI